MPPILSLQNITFSRPHRRILHDVSWSVLPGQLASVVGPNGCGKSTLLRIIAGYLWPASGSVSLFGQKFGETSLEDLRRRTGIVEATTVYPFDDDMTALDVVASGYFAALSIRYVTPTRRQWRHARQALAQVALGDRPTQLYTTLSTGERMRCLIARALVRKPELLLLDEPTAGLDLPARESVLATLQRLSGQLSVASGQNRPSQKIPPRTRRPSQLTTDHWPLTTAIILVTHHLEELLPGTSNALLLNHAGQIIAAGHPTRVFTSAHMTTAFQCPIQVFHRHHRYHAHVDPHSWQNLLT